MRSTFWPNRICERQSCQNCHAGLKFSPKREKKSIFMKIVQNRLFRSCGARFGQIAFVSAKVVKIVTLASNSLQKEKTVRFSWKLHKTLFSGHAQHVLDKSHFWASNFSKSLHLSQILFKTGKQCAFYGNCTKRSFQVMRSTFSPNRICERQSCQSRHTGLKFCSKRENSALFMKIVQNALFRSCRERFGQIAFLSIKVLKFVTLAWNSGLNFKIVRFPWKLYKTLFSGHAEHVLAKSHFWASKFLKSSHWPKILFKTGKQCSFHENCTKRSFQVIRKTFWPNRIFQCQSCQNRHTGLKFYPKRENCALFMKIAQNILFRSYVARFGQIVFVSVKVVKIVMLASNSLQKERGGRFSWKLYKSLFSGHAEHVLAKCHFWASKLLKSSHWPKILFKTGNSAVSMKIVQNVLFRSCGARFGQIAFVSDKVVKIVMLASNSLQKEKKSRFSWKLYKTVFLGHAGYVLAKLHFWALRLSKSSHWLQILSKKRKQCAFHENCTKRSFQVMRSTFWTNRIFEHQISQIRHTGLKFWPKL